MSAKVFLIRKTLSKHYLLKTEDIRSGKNLCNRTRAGTGIAIWTNICIQYRGCKRGGSDPNNAVKDQVSSPGRICIFYWHTHTHIYIHRRVISLRVHVFHWRTDSGGWRFKPMHKPRENACGIPATYTLQLNTQEVNNSVLTAVREKQKSKKSKLIVGIIFYKLGYYVNTFLWSQRLLRICNEKKSGWASAIF